MADNIAITQAWVDFWEAVLGEGDFSYDDIQRWGGPSQPTLTKLLRVGESVSPGSAKALEDAVGLERGSVRSVAKGGAPRWRPEWEPDGAKPHELGYRDRGESRPQFASIEDGYMAAGSWARVCWLAGAPKDLYYQFIDISVELYKAALDGRDRGASPDLRRLDLDLAAQAGDVQKSPAAVAQERAGEESQDPGTS